MKSLLISVTVALAIAACPLRAEITATTPPDAPLMVRLENAPPIDVVIRNGTVNDVLKLLAAECGLNYFVPASIGTAPISLMMKATPAGIIRAMEASGVAHFKELDGALCASSSSEACTKTYKLRFVGPDKLDKIRTLLAKAVGEQTQVTANPNAMSFFVIGTDASQLIASRFLEEFDRPQSVSAYSIFDPGSKNSPSRLQCVTSDDEPVTCASMLLIPVAGETVSGTTEVEYREVGTKLTLRRLGARSISYEYETTIKIGAGDSPTHFLTRTASGTANDDTFDISIGESKYLKEHSLFGIHWKTTVKLPERKIQIGRQDVNP